MAMANKRTNIPPPSHKHMFSVTVRFQTPSRNRSRNLIPNRRRKHRNILEQPTSEMSFPSKGSQIVIPGISEEDQNSKAPDAEDPERAGALICEGGCNCCTADAICGMRFLRAHDGMHEDVYLVLGIEAVQNKE